MVSKRSAVPPFEVMTILDQVARLRSAGRDIISLCAGEPAGGAPAGVDAAAARLHGERHTFGYTPALGISELRSALSLHYRNWYSVEVPPEAIAITTGSSGAFLLAFLAAFDPGDRVALARPGYPAYRNILTSLGCEVVDLPCGAEVRFQPTVEQLAAAHAQQPLSGLILASPANPTGTMISDTQLRDLTRWCTAHDVQLVSDEIYHGVIYTESRGTTALSYSEDVLVVSSLSKYWGMTGWRLGWLIAPPQLIAAVDALAGNLALCPPAPAQYAAVEAFSAASYTECDTAVAEFARARQLLLSAHADLGWAVAAPADGAFYYYADLGNQLDRFGNSTAYANQLLAQAGVALTPGTDFDDVAGDRCIRLSFAAGERNVAEAIARIKQFQNSLS